MLPACSVRGVGVPQAAQPELLRGDARLPVLFGLQT